MPTQLSFHERMDGFFAPGTDNPETGDVEGQKAGTTFAFEVTITTSDLDRFISDPDHPATVEGFYEGNFGPIHGRVTLDKGVFNFMSVGAGKQRLMEHHHVFEVDGKRYRLDGYKYLEHHPFTWDEWEQLTTLYTTIAALPAGSTFDPTTTPLRELRNVDPATIVAAGVTHFRAKDTLKLVSSFEVTGSSDPLGAKLRFLELFLGEEAEVLLAALRRFDLKGRRRTLSRPSADLAAAYDVVVIGSGYGGGVAAARLSGTKQNKSVCVLERGKEWRAGDFPDEPWDLPGALRTDLDPMGLLEFHVDDGIDALVGNGLGGTSLINANTMLRPDPAVLAKSPWPKALPDLGPYYAKAELALAAQKHPAPPLKSVMFEEAARLATPSTKAELAPLAVTFAPTHRAEADLDQLACTGCGGCVTGCNFGAKNTVDMNYLAQAERQGASIFTRVEVKTVERVATGYVVHAYDHARGTDVKVTAKQVVLAAGTYGTFGVLARSKKAHGLVVSDRLGEGFSGNGDVLGFGYNTDERTQLTEGPTITTVARYPATPQHPAFIVQEGGAPRAVVPMLRAALPIVRDVEGGGFWHSVKQWLRVQADVVGFESAGAMNHSLMYFAMGFEEKLGTLVLDAEGRARVRWPEVANEPFAKRADDQMQALTEAIGGSYLDNPLSRQFLGRSLITAHPIGGCAMGEDDKSGVVDARGEVFGSPGLFVADGSILATPLGANPALTITALAEWICERIVAAWP